MGVMWDGVKLGENSQPVPVRQAIELDLSGMDTEQRATLGGVLAYATHKSACEALGIAYFYALEQCLRGEAGRNGVTPRVSMVLDPSLLVTGTRLASWPYPGVEKGTDLESSSIATYSTPSPAQANVTGQDMNYSVAGNDSTNKTTSSALDLEDARELAFLDAWVADVATGKKMGRLTLQNSATFVLRTEDRAIADLAAQALGSRLTPDSVKDSQRRTALLSPNAFAIGAQNAAIAAAIDQSQVSVVASPAEAVPFGPGSVGRVRWDAYPHRTGFRPFSSPRHSPCAHSVFNKERN